MEKPIILVVGARPNFMKIAPLYDELKSRGIPQLLLHTGQHYDQNMSEFDLPLKQMTCDAGTLDI